MEKHQDDPEFLSAFKDTIKISQFQPNRFEIKENIATFRAALQKAKQIQFNRLSSITVVPFTEGFELLFQLSREAYILTIRLNIKAQTTLPTISDIFPAAALYEREIFSNYPIKIAGHPNLQPLYEEEVKSD